MISSTDIKDKLAEYEKIRARYPDSVGGQLRIAAWCGNHKLPLQQRAHLMHVLDLDPNHLEAREKLGFVRVGNDWVSREAIAEQRNQAAKTANDLKTWRPVVQQILKDLRDPSEEKQADAKDRLNKLHDPAAMPAMVEVALAADEDIALLFLEAQAQMAAPEAALALARAAAFSPSQVVRQAAAERLGERKLEEYVPDLLAAMSSPVTSQTAAAILPNGRLAFRQVFVSEAMDRQNVLQIDTQYQRVARVGGDRIEASGRAALDALNRVAARQQAAEQQNALTRALNDRIMWVLSIATKEQLADPAAWWRWWDERNEVYHATAKSVDYQARSETLQVVDYVDPRTQQQPSRRPTSQSGGSSPTPVQRFAVAPGRGIQFTHDCLAAGTKVWTLGGAAAIESIRVGDLVLARDQETGELAYKPVLRTTVRPKGPLIKLTIDGETIETSGGHLFWVSGDGWRRSRELEAGMILHGANGPSRVQAVEQGREAETYNLIVADFSTYFVGDAKVYSHDNTARQSTCSLVPGLRMD